MSMEAIRWVYEHAPRHGGPARAALVALAWHADDRGANAYPSHPTWANKAGMSERSLRRAITALEGEGTIARDGHRPGGGTVKWRICGMHGPANGGQTADAAETAPDPANAGRTAVRQSPPAGPANAGRSVRPTVAESVRPTLADKQSLNGPEQSEPSEHPLRSPRRTDAARTSERERSRQSRSRDNGDGQGHVEPTRDDVRASIRRSFAEADATRTAGDGA